MSCGIHTVCPYCDFRGEGAVPRNPGDRPSPGSILVCGECGEYSVFDQDLSLRKPTSSEIFQFMMEDDFRDLARAQVMVKLHKKFGKMPKAILQVSVNEDGGVQEIRPIPPEDLEPFLK